jgi:hypothetical protein
LALEIARIKEEEKLRREVITFAKNKLAPLLAKSERFSRNEEKFAAVFSEASTMTPMECVKFHAMCGCDDCREALERDGIRVNVMFGLVKGQHVSRHTRVDPRTGSNFVAGGKATGSPESVLVEKRTSSPLGAMKPGLGASSGAPNVDGPGSDSGGVAGEIMDKEGTIYDPDMIETVIRNLENAKVADLQTMVNDLFMQPRCMQRGIIAELILKEIMRRGLAQKSEAEEQMDAVSQEGKDMQLKAKEDQAKAKAKESADKTKPGSKPSDKKP